MSSLSNFQDDFSSSAFKTVDGVRRIVGKFMEIEVVGDAYDIYLVNRENPMSSQKLTWLLKAIEAIPEFDEVITRADGEAWFRTTSESLVRQCASTGGIKRKRRISEATRKASTERLARYNAQKGSA